MRIRCCLLAILLGGCQPSERQEPPAAAGAGPRTPAATAGAAEFQTIRWIEGTWRGTGGGVDPFYERYRLLDDSTLLRETFSDSSLAAVSDSTRIGVRGNRVVDPIDDPKWHATAFDTVGWRFESLEDAGRGFTWRRATADSWTATLEWRDGSGAAQQRVYTLERFGG